MLGPGPNPYTRIWPLGYHPESYTDRGLRELCDFGAREVAAGRYDGLRFNLFNGHEVEVIKAHMAAKHPGVQFRWNAITIADAPHVLPPGATRQ